MPEYTENYGLTLPLKTENYDLDHMTDSMRIIDTELKRVDDKAQEVEQDLTQHKLDYVEFSEDIQGQIDLIEEQVGEIKDDFESLENDYATFKDNTTLKVAKVERELNDYKATMQQVNINQEPKQKATGYGVISLPPNAANGQISVTVKGETLTSYIDETKLPTEDILFHRTDMRTFNITSPFKMIPEQIYTIFINVKNVSSEGIFRLDYRAYAPDAGWVLNKGINKRLITAGNDTTLNRLYFYIIQAAGENETVILDPTILVLEGDWTNKPTQPFFRGTKSTISAMRLKSVGKNKAPNKFNVGLWSGFPNPILNNNNVYRSLEPVKLKQGQPYTISGNNSDVRLFVYDKDGASIISSGSPLPPKTFTPLYTGYFYISMRNSSVTPWNYGNPQDIALQLEEGTTATPYEPYTESTQYITAKDEEDKIAELRSLPNGTKDEVSGGQHIRWVNPKLLESNMITRTNSNGVVSWAEINTNILEGSALWPWGLMGQISVENWTQRPSTGTASLTTADIGKFYTVTSNNINVLRFVFALGTTLEQAKEQLAGVKLTYQLATPIEIPIEVSGNLISYPNGTIYVEPFVADAGVYADKIEVLHQDLPIKAIEQLFKVDFMTGIEVPLDVGEVEIDESGLSFTHPELSAGDIVFFEYEYDVESTDGEAEAEFYDSRYVVKDTVTDKFYKWNIVVANGQPSIELVEV